MADTTDTRWVTAAALRAMAGQQLREGATFHAADLRAWASDFGSEASRKTAAARLLELGFITQRMVEVGAGRTTAEYTVTAAGAAAIQAAATGLRLKSGPKGPHQGDRTVPPGSFAARLWNLLRARQMLDPKTAAATLVDAGEDVEIAEQNARRYLRRWASTGAIAESRLRTAENCKRYVLVNTTLTTPPAWTNKAQARKATAITGGRA